MRQMKCSLVIGALAMRVCWGSSPIPEQTCIQADKKYKIRGYTPGGSAKKPLAVYLHGTGMPYDTPASKDYTKMMAEKGFVAINLEYESMTFAAYPKHCSGWKQKAKNISNCIDKVCQDFQDTFKIDCSLGVAMYGYSQGAQLALYMGSWNNHVTAALGISGSIMSAGGLAAVQKQCLASAVLGLSNTKRRIVIGENDGAYGGDGSQMAEGGLWDSGTPSNVIKMAEASAGYTTCTSKYDCIQDDGSGYYVATKNETGFYTMGHFWSLDMQDWQKLNLGFKTAAADKKWGLPACLTWLAEASITAPAPIASGTVAKMCSLSLLLGVVYVTL